jgi:hypothetical protein
MRRLAREPDLPLDKRFYFFLQHAFGKRAKSILLRLQPRKRLALERDRSPGKRFCFPAEEDR